MTQGETFRFEWLISSLEAFSDLQEGVDLEVESAAWEWRTAALGLVNAMTASGVDLEMRCDLRGEMRRRGFDHAVDVRPLVRYELMSRNYWIVNRLIHL
jgi:diaphanous 1